MTRVITLFLVVVLNIAVARPAAAQDWRLMEADRIAPDSFLVLTVPMDEPEVLTEIADRLSVDFGVTLAAEWPLISIDVHCLVYDVSGIPDIDALIAAMRGDARIRTVQRMQGFTLSGVSYPDPLFPLQSAFEQMNVLAAHEASDGDGVRIGIVDSAIDRKHPDLAGRISEVRDFVSLIPSSMLAEDHGTAVAGVIGAEAANDGIVGVAPRADLIGLRACWQGPGEPGRCNSFSLARAINFAILAGIDVLNLSIGGPDDPLVTELIDAAVDAGMVVVAAAGEAEATAFPASIDGVIAAGGDKPDCVPAPMIDVISTAPGMRHSYYSGSSIATAHVSGVVALLLAHEPALPVAEVSDRLMAGIRVAGAQPMLDACQVVLGVAGACNR